VGVKCDVLGPLHAQTFAVTDLFHLLVMLGVERVEMSLCASRRDQQTARVDVSGADVRTTVPAGSDGPGELAWLRGALMVNVGSVGSLQGRVAHLEGRSDADPVSAPDVTRADPRPELGA
jgi:hypothetical protein